MPQVRQKHRPPVHPPAQVKLRLQRPPRNGGKAQIENLAKSHVENIIMISCNPKSFVVDAKILLDAGYKIIKFNAIDQFYYTHHLEVMSIFTKK